MLADYHVHLTEDRLDLRPSLNRDRLLRLADTALSRGIEEVGVTEHCNRFVEFANVFDPVKGRVDSVRDVDRWLEEMATCEIDRYIDLLRTVQEEGAPLTVGLEVDFIPESSGMIGEVLSELKLDYVLGSVHFLGPWALDYSSSQGWPGRKVDDVYREYYRTVAYAASTGLFDAVAHIDLPKKFGFRPTSRLVREESELVAALAKADVCVEVNTAGLRKPVSEIYPERGLLAACRAAGVRAVLGSDAHRYEDVGSGFDVASELLAECGYSMISRFLGRKEAPTVFG